MATAVAAPTFTAVAVGNPNVGKSTLINALAGSRLEVGNWSGTTVEKLSARRHLEDRDLLLVDLPGAYSLAATNTEEKLTREELLKGEFDLILNVVDATNLERNLYLTLELLELGRPVVVVLNLLDEAQAQGHHPDPRALSERLGVPVVATDARSGKGVSGVLFYLDAQGPPKPVVEYPESIEQAMADRFEPTLWESLEQVSGELDLVVLEARFACAEAIAKEVVNRVEVAPRTRDYFDRLLLHPVVGAPLFLLALLLTFRFTFLFSDPWIEFFGLTQEVLAGWVGAMGLPDTLRSFLADGVIGGLGTVVAFAPVLFFLYLGMSFLESSGFLARISVLADRIARAVGLSGRSLIPLVLGFGCNVPAIYATRGLESFSERLRTAMAVPFMACSARLAVFALFASIFFPDKAALVVFGLYLLGLVVGLLTAGLLRGRAGNDEVPSGVMELPPYRLPGFRLVLRQAAQRTWAFIKGAGGMITVTVLAIWLMLHIPAGSMEKSLYGSTAKVMSYAFAPMGVEDWRLVGALMPGFIAKEVVIGTLGVSYLGTEPVAALGLGEGLMQLGQGLGQAGLSTLNAFPAMFGLPEFLPEEEAPAGLPALLASSVSAAGALAYLVFLLLYTPCVATVAAIRDEFGKKWALFTVFYQLGVAYFGGILVYWVARAFL